MHCEEVRSTEIMLLQVTLIDEQTVRKRDVSEDEGLDESIYFRKN